MQNHSNQKELFGQPIGLYVLFFTEMWERFSFYGMKALLLLYLVKYHLFTDSNGNLTVGSYAFLVYAMPVIGGYLADNYLGYKKAVTFGAILLVLGHLGMAFEGTSATTDALGNITRDEQALLIFYFSLALIIMGVGFLKANISTIVGELYHEGDQRRDSGFTIFYMGINLGSLLATIICGWLGETYGWKYGFGAAGIGMFFGLMTFLWGSKYFYGKADPKDPAKLYQKVFLGIDREWLIYIVATLGVFVLWYIIQYHESVRYIMITVSILALGYILYYASKLDKVGRDRLLALTILILFTVIFWALFEQAYTSLTLFADRVTDRSIFGWEMQASQTTFFNALFIVLFAPLFAMLWIKLSKIHKNPNTAVKFALGLLFAGLGFGVLILGDQMSSGLKIGIIWLVLCYMFHTFGELCLSPVGLSAVTKLSPPKIVGFMMGVWFFATASSEYIAALLANIASIDHSNDTSTNVTLARTSYINLFNALFWTGIISGLILLAISPILNKMMHGADSTHPEKEVVN